VWRVAGLRVRSPSPPRATRRYASRLVFFFMVRSRLPSRRFRDFFFLASGARNRSSHCRLGSKWPARDSRDRSFCFPARIDDSKTVGRAGQSSSPYEIGANSAQAAAPFGRGSDRGAPSSADNAARGSTRPIDGRTFLRRVVSLRLGSIERVHATFPGEASKAVRCGPAKPHARRPAVVA
jgi:hypothetical protein